MSKEEMPETGIQKNDAVLLKRTSKYRSEKCNPKIGSKHECSGIVIGTTSSQEMFVTWKNGYTNVYRKSDLVLCEKEYKSIW